MSAGLKLKVCGMRDPENILEVSRLEPDFMGFIFYAPSPRYVGDKFRMPVFSGVTKKVGVFVNEATDVILQKVHAFGLDLVQLHGNESVGQCREIKSEGIGVIKVFSVASEMDFSLTEAFRPVVDHFLFDTKGEYYGGNAKRFDWEVLMRYHGEVPFFLSGGITPEHIEDVRKLKHDHLQAIDVNSGVEIGPALKDVQQIKVIKTTLNPKH
jgi:phosphoribosylanthranilate isomerase